MTRRVLAAAALGAVAAGYLAGCERHRRLSLRRDRWPAPTGIRHHVTNAALAPHTNGSMIEEPSIVFSRYKSPSAGRPLHRPTTRAT